MGDRLELPPDAVVTIKVSDRVQGVDCPYCEGNVPHEHLPVVVDAGDEDQRFATQQEAIDALVAQSADGDEITIHEAECQIALDECTCTPLTMTVRKGSA